MSSNNYYYQQSAGQYSGDPAQQAWSSWPVPPPPPAMSTSATHYPPQQQQNAYGTTPYTPYAIGHTQSKGGYEPRGYSTGNSQNHRYNNHQNRANRYQNNHQYGKSSTNWQHMNRHSTKKRNRQESQQKSNDNSSGPIVSVARKKKKPLSQNTSKKGWNEEDAEKAFKVEKEYNSKTHSLVIKFPDPELSKDIVKAFHPAIENVHFQQASTPRFCFVTLEKSADVNLVMHALNRQKFGQGYLTAELKKDKDEEKVTAKDIDPYTLYVGNLSNEVTKQAVRDKYPKTVRIDIGYAQKMKYTRYAFVRFACVNDSIEAFRETYNSDLYARSLIVRFRRLHGNTDLKTIKTNDIDINTAPGDDTKIEQKSPKPDKDCEPETSIIVPSTAKKEEKTEEQVPEKMMVDLNLVKDEPESSDENDGITSFFMHDELDEIDVNHSLLHIKKENDITSVTEAMLATADDDDDDDDHDEEDVVEDVQDESNVNPPPIDVSNIKKEKDINNDNYSSSSSSASDSSDDEDTKTGTNSPSMNVNVKVEPEESYEIFNGDESNDSSDQFQSPTYNDGEASDDSNYESR